MGLTSLASSVVHLLLRDRRRGDIVMLVLVLIIPIVAIAPQFFFHGAASDGRQADARRARRRCRRRGSSASRCGCSRTSRRRCTAARGRSSAPAPGERGAAAGRPRACRAGGAGRRIRRVPPRARHARVTGDRGAPARSAGLWNRVIPGLSPGGVRRRVHAAASRRCGTPRGRATIALAAADAARAGGARLPPRRTADSRHPGPTTVWRWRRWAASPSILGLIPLSMNQFAIDKAGFTRLHAVAAQRRRAALRQGGRQRAHRGDPDDRSASCCRR